MSLNPAGATAKRDSYLHQIITRATSLAEEVEATVEVLTSKLSGVMRVEIKGEKEKAPPDEAYPPMLEELRGAITRIERGIRCIQTSIEVTEV